MKKVLPVAVCLAVVVNLMVLYHVMRLSKSYTAKFDSYTSKIEQQTTRFDELISDVDVVKKIVGWKTEKYNDTVCIGDTSRMQDGPFSFVLKSESGCYNHEFTKLNRLAKILGVSFIDGRLENIIGQMKQFDLENLRNLPIVKDPDLKTKIKDVIEEFQK